MLVFLCTLFPSPPVLMWNIILIIMHIFYLYYCTGICNGNGQAKQITKQKSLFANPLNRQASQWWTVELLFLLAMVSGNENYWTSCQKLKIKLKNIIWNMEVYFLWNSCIFFLLFVFRCISICSNHFVTYSVAISLLH